MPHLFYMQKYKVFINDKWIFFGVYKKEQFSEYEKYDVLDANYDLIFNLSEMIKNGSFDRNIVVNLSEEGTPVFDYFLSRFLVLEAAGGIVHHISDAFLMIKRFGVWDFPKGKIEKGETTTEAALREVEEETGVKELRIIQDFPIVFHIYRHARQWIVKKTFWFYMESDFKGKPEPQKEEDILEAAWIPKAQLPHYLSQSYDSLRELIKDSGLLDKP